MFLSLFSDRNCEFILIVNCYYLPLLKKRKDMKWQKLILFWKWGTWDFFSLSLLKQVQSGTSLWLLRIWTLFEFCSAIQKFKTEPKYPAVIESPRNEVALTRACLKDWFSFVNQKKCGKPETGGMSGLRLDFSHPLTQALFTYIPKGSFFRHSLWTFVS